MSILETPRQLKRALVALAALVASVAAVTIAAAAGASPASAAACVTPGPASLTQPGRAFFSGYEGDQRFGVPTVSYIQGAESFRFGGNGILPGTGINFVALDDASGAQVALLPWSSGYATRGARSNCVVNEEGPFT